MAMMKKTALLVCICAVLASLFHAVQGYTVVGNKIYDPNGKQVLIRGIDRPSLEWNAAGQHLAMADYGLMKNLWKANVVRVSLNQDYWLAGSAYRATVRQQVDWIRGYNMGVIFDLHWNNGQQQPMADRNSITFWAQVAAAYKNEPWVMFELYNEPYINDWNIWRNGGSGYAGMQEMYNAVRNAGASNLVIVCGLNWAYDLSGVPNHAITGTDIAYATHPYDYDGKRQLNWDSGFGFLAATYPVIMTEFGQYCNTGTYVYDLLEYADRKGIHWTAWAWWSEGCAFPSIIADWNGTPTPIGSLVYKKLTGTDWNGGGSGSGSGTTASSATVTTGTTPPAGSAVVVYTDGLVNGWMDWSWSNDKIVSDGSRKYAGSSSFKFAVKADEAIYFSHPSGFTLGSYASIQFYANGASSLSSTLLAVLLYDSAGNVGTHVNFPTNVAANQWTLISIPLTSFGVSSSMQFFGFAIQAKTSGNAGYVWIDEVTIRPPEQTSTTRAQTTTGSATSGTATTRTVTTGTTAGTTAAGTVTTASLTTQTVTSGTPGSTGTATTRTVTTAGTVTAGTVTTQTVTTGTPGSTGTATTRTAATGTTTGTVSTGTVTTQTVTTGTPASTGTATTRTAATGTTTGTVTTGTATTRTAATGTTTGTATTQTVTSGGSGTTRTATTGTVTTGAATTRTVTGGTSGTVTGGTSGTVTGGTGGDGADDGGIDDGEVDDGGVDDGGVDDGGADDGAPATATITTGDDGAFILPSTASLLSLSVCILLSLIALV